MTFSFHNLYRLREKRNTYFTFNVGNYVDLITHINLSLGSTLFYQYFKCIMYLFLKSLLLVFIRVTMRKTENSMLFLYTN